MRLVESTVPWLAAIKVPRVKFLIVYWGLWRKFKLLGTLEKVQNNIGGNTGQSSSPRLWNTLINANKG